MLIDRRFVLTGLISAPAVIAADRLMPVRSIVQRYATVYGVGHDFEVIEWIAWDVQDALRFARSLEGVYKFREITDIVYGFPMPPLPTPAPTRHWQKQTGPINVTGLVDRSVNVNANGFTNVTSFSKINEWRESLRPDLDGHLDHRWVQEQIFASRRIGTGPVG